MAVTGRLLIAPMPCVKSWRKNVVTISIRKSGKTSGYTKKSLIQITNPQALRMVGSLILGLVVVRAAALAVAVLREVSRESRLRLVIAYIMQQGMLKIRQNILTAIITAL